MEVIISFTMVKVRIAVAKKAFNNNKSLLSWKLNLELKQKTQGTSFGV